MRIYHIQSLKPERKLLIYGDSIVDEGRMDSKGVILYVFFDYFIPGRGVYMCWRIFWGILETPTLIQKWYFMIGKKTRRIQ